MATLTATARRRLPGERRNDWQAYHRLLGGFLREGMTVVDVGCGRGRVAPFPWSRYPGVRLVGVDPDVAARDHPQLAEFHLLRTGRAWPLGSEMADLVTARYVLEHVAEPEDFLGNVYRVLRPGGRFLFLTPNRRHPAMVVSRLLPLAVKRRILGYTGRIAGSDLFATRYRMNTPRRIQRLARTSGFAIEALLAREFVPCAYLEFCWAARLIAGAYFLAVTTTGLEHYYGAHLIGVMRKH